MRRFYLFINFMVLLTICGSAWADRGHAHVGIVIGSPWGWPYYPPAYYPPAYYYPPSYPPTVVVRPSESYVEQAPALAAPVAPVPQETAYWHYCSNPQGYYPYVKECPAGWQKVAPQPPQR